jgi:hypothetical protein
MAVFDWWIPVRLDRWLWSVGFKVICTVQIVQYPFGKWLNLVRLMNIRRSRSKRRGSSPARVYCASPGVCLRFGGGRRRCYGGSWRLWRLIVHCKHPVGNPKRKVWGAHQQVSLSCETKVYRTSRRKPNIQRWCLLALRRSRQWR